MQKDKAGAGALILEFPPKQSVTAVKRRTRLDLKKAPSRISILDALRSASETIEDNAKELEEYFPVGHPGLENVKKLAMVAAYLIDCSERHPSRRK